jgi:hypothetical protein
VACDPEEQWPVDPGEQEKLDRLLLKADLAILSLLWDIGKRGSKQEREK